MDSYFSPLLFLRSVPAGNVRFVKCFGFFLFPLSPRRRLLDDLHPAEHSPPERSGRRSAVLPCKVLEFRYYFTVFLTSAFCISEIGVAICGAGRLNSSRWDSIIPVFKSISRRSKGQQFGGSAAALQVDPDHPERALAWQNVPVFLLKVAFFPQVMMIVC